METLVHVSASCTSSRFLRLQQLQSRGLDHAAEQFHHLGALSRNCLVLQRMAVQTTGPLCSLCREMMIEIVNLDDSLWSTESWTDVHCKWWYTWDNLLSQEAGSCSICDFVRKIMHVGTAPHPYRGTSWWVKVKGRRPSMYIIGFMQHEDQSDISQQNPPMQCEQSIRMFDLKVAGCSGSLHLHAIQTITGLR
jgi:hypothetical protein